MCLHGWQGHQIGLMAKVGYEILVTNVLANIRTKWLVFCITGGALYMITNVLQGFSYAFDRDPYSFPGLSMTVRKTRDLTWLIFHGILVSNYQLCAQTHVRRRRIAIAALFRAKGGSAG